MHVLFDDIIIAGKDVAEHDRILLKVLERAKVNGIKFNSQKFQFRVSEVKYIGNIVSASGLKVDPDKVKAIVEYPAPTSKQDLQRFFGMVNYLGQFVTNLSKISAPLRMLLKKDMPWQWSNAQARRFLT